MSETVLEHLIARIRQAAIYNRHDLAVPKVVLWPDGDRVWAKTVHLVRDAMPELLILNASVADERTGPSTWLRYQLTRGNWRDTPVLYLPDVPRHAFRGAAGFPEAARHLFALQYQGQFWSQANGKDWTPSAFLSATDAGLGLDLARDRATLEALSAQLAHVLRSPLASLTGRRLEAADFHGLAASDPVGMLLEWMGSQGGSHEEWAPERWVAFAALSKQTFALDPDKDGVITAAERLAGGGGIWDQVWKRYREAPKSFAGVRKTLDLVQPKDLIDAVNERIPANNRRDEDALRKGLTGLAKLPAKQALTGLAGLCATHALRAHSLWADLGEAPLARAAVHLQALAEGIAAGNLGNDWKTVAEAYLERGGIVDASAWKAYAAVRDTPDLQALARALRAVYLPWLEDMAERVQGWSASYPMSAPSDSPVFEPVAGTVLVFVDGLRCDVGLELQHMLAEHGLEATLEARWSALPTVTATAKPAWRPLADGLTGESLPEGFEPQTTDAGKPLKTPGFRDLLAAHGWTWLEPTAAGDPAGAAWTEVGTFDHDGHSLGARLAWRIEEELRAVVLRVRELLNAGWKRAMLVTDHGWLLVPGGLPKVDLPSHLTLSRWPRCAVPQPGAHHGFKELPWFWGGGHCVVSAPGVSAFKVGVEYAHGGLSLQEALVPVVTVSSGEQAPKPVEIATTKWVGLRLKVQLQGAFSSTVLDIRTKPADDSSSLLGTDQRMKPPAHNGSASLLVASDEHLGAAAVLVVIRGGQVVAKRPVTIGED